MPIYELPDPQVDIARTAMAVPLELLGNIDLKIGVEQIVQSDDYFTEADIYFNGGGPAPVITQDQRNAFRLASRYTKKLTDVQVTSAMEALVDDETFRDYCVGRWEITGRLPVEGVEVNLAGIPDGA